MIGGKGDGVADDRPAFIDFFAARKELKRKAYIPPADVYYKISGTIVAELKPGWDATFYGQGGGAEIEFDKNARFVASAPMSSMLQIGTAASDYSGIVINGLVSGGHWVIPPFLEGVRK